MCINCFDTDLELAIAKALLAGVKRADILLSLRDAVKAGEFVESHPALSRERGVWVPDDDVQMHILNGWTVADPGAGGLVLMMPGAGLSSN